MLGMVFALPFILVLVVFALSNAGPVSLGFWPTDVSLVVPLSLAVLGAGALFFVLGGVVVGITSVSQRRRARRAESQVRALQQEIESLRPRAGTIMPGSAVRIIEG